MLINIEGLITKHTTFYDIRILLLQNHQFRHVASTSYVTIQHKILTVESFDKLGVRKKLTSKILINYISLKCKQLLGSNL